MNSIKHIYRLAVITTALLGFSVNPAHCMNEGEHPALPRAAVSPQEQFFDAVCRGDVQGVSELLRGDHGIDIDAPDKLGIIALSRATRRGNGGDMVRLLLSAKADTEKSYANQKRTPLHDAIHFFQSFDVVKMLLDAKANPNAVNDDGRTPLYKAVLIEDDRVIHLLVEAKAVVNVFDKFRTTPLDIAIRTKNQAAEEALRGYRAIALQPEAGSGSCACSKGERR